MVENPTVTTGSNGSMSALGADFGFSRLNGG
jgi:hypothetical protein